MLLCNNHAPQPTGYLATHADHMLFEAEHNNSSLIQFCSSFLDSRAILAARSCILSQKLCTFLPAPDSYMQGCIQLAAEYMMLQAFMNSAKAHSQFRPLPSPALHLSTAEQCRIRDRSTIVARHLFADRGDAFADQQVPGPSFLLLMFHTQVISTSNFLSSLHLLFAAFDMFMVLSAACI